MSIDIIQEYSCGKSLREIEALTGIDHTTIYRKLKKAGIIRSRAKELPVEEIIALNAQSLSHREISRQLGISHPTVSKILKKNKNNLLDELYRWINKYCNFVFIDNGLYCKEKNYYLYCLEFNTITDKNYCKNLLKSCNAIIFFEDEWRQRRKQVEDFILAKLGIYSKRVFARKCIIREVEKKEAIKFICNNHIQPLKNAGVINLGLYYENNLLGVCQLRKHHRNSKEITISRMCFLEGVQITGGFSRLVKHAVAWCFANGYEKVITWSDNRLTSGDSYLKAGFTCAGKLPSDYSYIHPSKPGQRFSKQSMKKSNINCPEGYTEREWTEKLGYKRIWDCGKLKFEYYKQ